MAANHLEERGATAEISITATGEREFEVHVRDGGGGETQHRVTVPDRIGDAIDPDEHGLETLTDISRYFPKYPDGLARRLA